MKKTLFVHSGTHKTGTTSFQQFIRINAPVLEKHGLYIPTAGTTGPDSGHHNLVWQLNGDARYNDENGNLDTLVNELEICRRDMAFISSENFEYLVEKGPVLGMFESRLAAINWQVIYIVFLRNQFDYMEALYAELLKHGLKLNYIMFVLKILVNGKFNWNGGWCFYFDYYRFISKFHAASDSEIRVFSYDHSRDHDSLIADIISSALPFDSIKGELTFPDRKNVTDHSRWHKFPHLEKKVIGLRFLRSNERLRKNYKISL